MIFVVLGKVLIHLLAKNFQIGKGLQLGGMVVAGVTPVGKLAKVGKGVKMTSEAVEAANLVKKASKVNRSISINSGERNGSISVDEWLKRDDIFNIFRKKSPS